MKHFLIDLLAFAALFSSVLVITSKNPVIAVIFLISVFVNELNGEIESSQKLLSRATEILKKNKFSDDNNSFIESIKEFINEYYNFLDTLSISELGSLANLLAAIFTLLCVMSLITIIYSNMFITYLNLESKFPRIANILKYRKKLQNYYLFMNLLFIVITLLLVIYVNYLALTI